MSDTPDTAAVFSTAAAFIVMATDQKATAGRLNELREATETANETRRQLAEEQAALKAQKAGDEAAIEAKRAQADKEIDRRWALINRAESDLKASKEQHARQIADSRRVLERYEGYWSHRFHVAGIASIAHIPNLTRPLPRSRLLPGKPTRRLRRWLRSIRRSAPIPTT
jgi:hypothetical protein